MPHPRLGKVGALDCGGGCYVGYPQAVQNQACIRAGINFDSGVGVSVGALNLISPNQTPKIWEECFNTPGKIYRPDPELRQIVTWLLDKIPHWRTHEDWGDFFQDSKVQINNLFGLLRFGGRTLASISRALSSPASKEPTIEKALPALYLLLEAAKALGLDRLQSAFDLTPLFETLKHAVDFQKVCEERTLHILARHRNEVHIFSTRPSPALEKMYRDRLHALTSGDEPMLALRAATALPPFFPAVEIAGKEFNDAGAIAPFPAEILFADGCDTILAFANDYSSWPPPPRDIYRRLVEETHAGSWALSKSHYEQAKKIARRKSRRLYRITTHQPTHPDLQVLWISPTAIEQAKRVEQEYMQRFLKKLLS